MDVVTNGSQLVLPVSRKPARLGSAESTHPCKTQLQHEIFNSLATIRVHRPRLHMASQGYEGEGVEMEVGREERCFACGGANDAGVLDMVHMPERDDVGGWDRLHVSAMPPKLGVCMANHRRAPAEMRAC